MNKKNKILLALIVVLAFALRLANLANLPAILNRDEAALAYNAYLVKDAGMDEWQSQHPLLFKSFGDYKLPGYIYLLSFLFRFLPMNDFVVRLPSAIFGSALVLLAFFFAKDILKVKKGSALLMSLLVAVTPVFFFYSRIAFEANVALFLFILSFYLLFKEKENLILAAIVMFLAVLTYNTPLLLLPFIMVAYLYHRGFKNLQKLVLPILLFGVILLWAFVNFYHLTSQKSSITIFSDPSAWENFASYRNSLSPTYRIFVGNKYVYYAQLIISNIWQSFSLKFLVQNGGSHPWHSLPGFAHLSYTVYFLAIFMLIDFIGEIFIALKDKKFNKQHLIYLFLLIAALAPSAVTVDSPHATRSLFFFFMMLAFAVMFVDKLLGIFSKYKKLIFSIVLLVLTVESLNYFRSYFFEYPQEQPKSLFVEYKNLIQEANQRYSDQPVAVIDDGGYQYILTAWYLKLPSQQFFATMKYQNADTINFYYGEDLLNYHFIKNLTDKTDDEKVVLSQDLGLIKYE